MSACWGRRIPTEHWELLHFTTHWEQGRWERLLYNNIISQGRRKDTCVLMQSMQRCGQERADTAGVTNETG